jgi:LacI family transcriptional regulator
MNIYDIAREAGVSIATISRVVNGKSVVSAKTREKVEAVLKKYNYTPDPTARSLVAKTTKTVAILAEDVREAYCGGVTYAVERELARIGYGVMLFNTGGTTQGVSEYIKSAVRHHADAVVITGMSNNANEAVIEAASSIPVVLINNFVDAVNIYSVLCDEVYGMMLAVGQLAGSGRRDILFVQDSDGYSAKKLAEGFEAGMAMNDLSSEGNIILTERGMEGGFACAETLIRAGRSFNAVVCGDDTTASGFIKCLHHNFIDVPADVSVIGFHNTHVAECCTPSLTSIDCRSDKAGAAAVKLLSSIFDGIKPERKSIVLPRLIRRESA